MPAVHALLSGFKVKDECHPAVEDSHPQRTFKIERALMEEEPMGGNLLNATRPNKE